MFKGKSKKVKAQLIKQAKELKKDSRENDKLGPDFGIEISKLIDRLEKTEFVKVKKDETLTLDNFQNIMNDIAIAVEMRNKEEAKEKIKTFMENLEKMPIGGRDGLRGNYTPKQLVELMIAGLRGAIDKLSEEVKELENDALKFTEKLKADQYNASLASGLMVVQRKIKERDIQITTAMDEIELYNNKAIRRALIESMEHFTETEAAILNDPETSDEKLALIQKKFDEAKKRAGDYGKTTKDALDHFDESGSVSVSDSAVHIDYYLPGKKVDKEERVNYADQLGVTDSVSTAVREADGDLFKNVEDAIRGYQLETMYYKYLIKDECEKKDALVKEIQDLFEKLESAAPVDKPTIEGQIRQNNIEVDTCTQSINRYQAERNNVSQKLGIARKALTEHNIEEAKKYNPVSKDFEAHFEKIAVELKNRAERRNIESGDLTALNEIIDSVQPNFDMVVSGDVITENTDYGTSADIEELRSKYVKSNI